MSSLSSPSSKLESSISALEVLRNFLHTEGNSVAEVETRLVSVYPDWSMDSDLSRLFSSIIECEPDDFAAFSQIDASIDAKVGALSLELYTRASPGPSTDISTEGPPILHILPTTGVQSSVDALDPALLARIPAPNTLSPPDPKPLNSVSSPSKTRMTLKEYAERKKERKESTSQTASAAPIASSPIHESSIGDFEAGVGSAFDELFPISRATKPVSPPPSTQSNAPVPGRATQSSSSAERSAERNVESVVDAIRSMDGKLGAVLIEKNIVVTTPNASVIYAPITPHCQTRMRRTFNFAKDDPIYWPQPFHLAVGHLAVVPCPSNDFDHPLRYAWYQLQDSDFQQIDREGVDGLVGLAVWIGTELRLLCSRLLDSIRNVDEERRADLFLSRGRDQMRKYMERLTMTGSRFRVSLVFSCLQRVYLETYARWQWLTQWYPRLCDVDASFRVDDSVMGAFTGDLSAAADLFRIGCPVWLAGVGSAFDELFPISRATKPVSPPPSTQSNAPVPGRATQSSSSAERSAERNVESVVDAIRSMDGKLGAVLIEKNIVVTTPNASVIYAPITPHCQTRMRRTFNFAKDDPIYWPQPFHLAVGHLAVVPCPSNDFDHPLRYAWYQLQDSDFQQIDREGVDGLVGLAVWIGTELRLLCSRLLDSIRNVDEERRADLFLSRGRDQMRKYMERLTMTGSRFRVSLVFSCLQRVYLETYARWQWLTQWYPRLCDVDASFRVDDSVMGAFTGDLSAAADLFRIGCPVWLVRPYTELVNIRIDHHVDPLDETADYTLPIRNSNDHVDVRDASPPHQLIYTGLPGRFTRYARISQFLQQHFSNPVIESFAAHDLNTQSSLITLSNVSSGSSSQITQSSTSPALPASHARYLKDLELINLALRNSITLPVLPPPKKKKKSSTGAESMNQTRRNRFLLIPSPFMPSRLPIWSDANNSLSEYHLRSGPSLLEQAYPPPDVFFTPSNDLKVSLLLVWLRLRPLFQWKLSLPTCLKGYKNMEWRALFEAIDGKKVESMKTRGDMLRELEDLCRQSSLVFQFDKLPLPRWGSEVVEVNSNGQLDARLVTEVLWELLEVNFRTELITLDRAVVPEPQGDSDASIIRRDYWLDREQLINSCWVGQAHRPLITSPGLSSDHPYEYRIVFLKALTSVLKSWPGVKPPELDSPFPDSSSIIFDIELRRLEEAIAYYYTRKFLTTFHRAATIPHKSPYESIYTHYN
ncbi:hypothetical protein C8R42DRAFT_728282 [Lentinula raphanica]|nr:hypothetical protein C8R42DRAFT_728282 [Lentinula raphanica]